MLAVLVCAGCLYEEPPSTRTFQLGDARRYVKGEHRYRSEVTLRKAGQAPAAVAGVTTTLRVDLLETVTPEGKSASVSVAVIDADASGDDAKSERNAALGRSMTIVPTKNLWEITFAGGSLGSEGRVRAIDLILLAHLMAPSEPAAELAVGDRIPESASIRTGWSTKRLQLSGASALGDRDQARGRTVSSYDSTLTADAFVSTKVGVGPAPTKGEIAEATGTAAALQPLACLFTLLLACLMPSAYFSALPSASIDLSGPMTIASQARVHQSSGRLLSASGQGRATLGGKLPSLGDTRSRPGGDQVLFLSARPVALDLNWTFSEELADNWPKDPLPTPLVAAAALALAVVMTFLNVAGIMYWRRRR